MKIPLNYNLRNLVQRKGTTIMTAVGIALTVAVLVVVMALTSGLDQVVGGSGDPRHIIVLRKGVDAELSSTITNDAYQIVRTMPGVAKSSAGEPLVSQENMTVVNLPNVDDPKLGMNVSVRGITPLGIGMRPLTMVRGKMFEPGLRQVVVGESIAKRYPAAQIGKTIRFGRGDWEVVGVFQVGETAANSEIWADLNLLGADFERGGGSSSLLVRLEDNEVARSLGVIRKRKPLKTGDPVPPAPDGTLMAAIDSDQRLNAQALGETETYAKMTDAGKPIQYLGFMVAIIMAIGSAFAATNTMYAAVARRSREIATMRALGFPRFSILASFLLESVCLALLGGIIGVLIALPINGLQTAAGSFVTFSEVAFKFRVSWQAIVAGLLFAAVIGALGGFLPAWSAARRNLVQTMRNI